MASTWRHASPLVGLGAVVLSILPELVKDHLGGGAGVVTFTLGLFSVGVGLGALLCEKLSYEQIELGVVPLGALGLSIYLAWVGVVTPMPTSRPPCAPLRPQKMLTKWSSVRL